MLKQRVLTAIVLLAGLSAALRWLDLAAWSWLVALILGLAGWEWGRLAGLGRVGSIVSGLVTFLVVAAAARCAFDGAGTVPDVRGWLSSMHVLAILFWLLAVPLWMWRGGRPARGLLMLTGAVVLVPPALALIQLRAEGLLPLLLLMAVVWIADIAAYFTGRALGRHKLAPAISPGKTWEGAAGAVVAVQLYGLAIKPWLFPPDQTPAPMTWAAVLLVLTAVSIVGDLFESMMKRQAGMKDSSQLLPGHGGILDRIDSLTATLPLIGFALLHLFAGTPS
ncbi:MAG: phosphatidate cytidylyltransferase [Gammaproteobacteria bacterium]|jgi:phosphatidate cytidylyltransferase|nr:phosphatidate cytidylyltransferase [Gammaproteobacteria bacterium]MBU0770532.1 phosphatidate cytidylyltransferase [Gammaproteobacteria bacterium]MBU0857489.1 phosphatidate cytidylyltransferase [Gammaproteobacteria bacterium]MBU1845219.1 phosphatidate cytidylyltransferase [Gammaproteobacteria bacterium]